MTDAAPQPEVESFEDLLAAAKQQGAIEPDPPPEPAPEPVPAPEPDASPAKGTDSAPPAEAAPPADADDDDSDDYDSDPNATVPRRVFVATRKKQRDKYEERLSKAQSEIAFLKGQMAAAQGGQPKPAPPEPQQPAGVADDDFYAEPTAAAAKIAEEAVRKERMRLSAETMRDATKDYDEVVQWGLKAIQELPPGQRQSVEAQVMAAGSPAKRFYDWANDTRRAQELGATSFSDLEQKLRAKIEAEYEEKRKQALAESQASSVTPSNAGATGFGASATAALGSMDPLDLIEEAKRGRRR